ncbi:two-component system regulatory protein YycI [Leuconostoc gelidum subsp. aenigmaticum]|uniref:two-component system regulatory protein YycI n=1 Tax=Leuconostoc gelidum TaxID=1244 RepID=UPI001CC4CC0B|nr:two-component system regulatory protein YycI [Leuconostoc gelidum]MBZ6003642.1 two-component system regulatory protein YycI [Leuconostoc gelidum subsp. aenigmaticum]
MQFKRIKILMLILFFLLDIFLLNWWRSGEVSQERVTDANTDIISEMKKQKIKLPKFGTSLHYSSYVAAQYGDRREMSLPAGLDVSTGANTNTVFAKFKRDLFKKNGTGSDESVLSTYSAGYQFNPVLTANKTNRDRVYSQRVEGLPVIADSGIMTFQYNKSGKPVGFTKRQLVNIERLRDDRATITEEEAIISLYRYNEIDSGDSLSKGYLSYDRTLTVNGYDIFLPVWVFEAYSGNEKYVLKINAFTGDNLSE